MSRLARYEAHTDRWLTALALLFLLVYGIPIVWPGLPPRAQAAFAAANVAIWAVFALDLAARTALAGGLHSPRRLGWSLAARPMMP